MLVNNAIKILFEEKKVDELVKHYTEDCKFIVLPESQTISGQSGMYLHVVINVVIPTKTTTTTTTTTTRL
jgi:ketosteroid isomerase-like protein